jgi:hypothetical protein
VRQTVDLARQAVRGLIQRLEGGGLEQRQRGAGQAQAMRDVVGELLARQAAQVLARA